MAHIDGLWRYLGYQGRRAVVTGCASGIGEHVVRQLTELGAEVIGLDRCRPSLELNEFHEIDLADPQSIDAAVAAVGGRVDTLFNVAGVSSGIGKPALVATTNFLGTRQLTEALVPRMAVGSSIVSVSSLAAAGYREHAAAVAPLLNTPTMQAGIEWCRANPDALGNGYQLSKEAIIYYTMRSATPLGAKGIRINCSGPGVTETPILDQLRTAYGQGFLDDIPKPLGRVSDPAEQAAVLLFCNSGAASYITGQIIWVDGGNVGAAIARELEEGSSAR
ncbi:coniferyl-alcohol dehydrogenase [Mycobacterium genavense]|uniref:coniferyl-alcohol dehydrogenase n=1 Tax=Mycobacterium genavense TaxID=36812 RepID=UPI0004721AA4|nr:coniferyl-alcohol dehydrogenase [Mycobacterium genavense]